MQYRRTFRDNHLQEEFEEMGYVILPFLSEAEINKLLDIYHSLKNDLGKGFHATMHSHDIDYKRKVSGYISEVFTPKAQEILLDYRPLVSNYTVKEPGMSSFFDFHLDWNMVDEERFRSITIWCPLTDTCEENGNLWVLEKSHSLGTSYRCGPGLALYFVDPGELSKARFVKKSLAMKKGQAVIYDHKLFHGSPPNLTDKVRVAINQAMAPAEAPAMHYARIGQDDIMAFEVDDDFFCRVIIDKLELENPVKRIAISGKSISQDVVNALIV